MLYSGKEEPTKSNNSPVVNNQLGPVTTTKGQRIGFTILCVLTLGIAYLWIITSKNNLRKQQIEINEAASGIEVQLNKRFDTLTKLVDTVKSQMKFDKEVLENITAYRSMGKEATAEQKEQVLSNMQRAINISFEAYPQIGADASVRTLMNESIMIEKEIAASRRLYNAKVTRFNGVIYTFPKNIAAEKEGISGIPLFSATEQAKQDVKMNLY